jgi:hypothetical protein
VREALPPNTALFWDLGSPFAYTSYMPLWLHVRPAVPMAALGWLRALGTTHVAAFEPVAVRGPVPGGLEALARPAEGFGLFRVRRPLGPAWLVGRRVEAPNWFAALDRCLRPGFDPEREVHVSEPPRGMPTPDMLSAGGGPPSTAADAPSPGTVEVLEDTETVLEVDVRAAGPATLVVPRTWYPGWTAVRASRETLPVRFANGGTMAVPVPGGGRVRLTYAPPWRSTAWTVSLGSLGLLLAAAGLSAHGKFVSSRPRPQ